MTSEAESKWALRVPPCTSSTCASVQITLLIKETGGTIQVSYVSGGIVRTSERKDHALVDRIGFS